MSDQKANLPAAVYCRISRDSEATGLGVQRQEADCRKLAAELGWDVVEVYQDNDTSAFSGKPRPAYRRMVAEIEAGRIQAVLVWDVDRLTRTPTELESVILWADQHQLALASVGGHIDLGTPQGRLTARIKGDVARHESEQMSRRLKRKHQELAAAGTHIGPVPFGWRKTADKRLVVDEAGAAIVREAYRRLLAGESIRAIVYDWAQRGITTGRGNKWQAANFRHLVLRWANCGVRTHRGREVGAGDWPALVSREDHERVVALLSDPARKTTNRGTEVKYLLSGIAVCAECDQPMQGARKHSYPASYRRADGTLRHFTRTHPDRYRCNFHGCRKVSASMAHVDQTITDFVIDVLTLQGVEILGGDPGAAEDAQARVESLEARLSIAADQFADGDLTGDQLKRITARLTPQLDQARADQRQALPAEEFTDFAGPGAAQAWEAADVERRRAVVRILTAAGLVIRLQKAGRRSGPKAVEFNPETVGIRWKSV